MRNRYTKRGRLKTVCVVIGIMMILLSFKDGFERNVFLPGAVLTALGIVLFKRKKSSVSYTS
jgi:xanthine/uracil permease